MSLFPCPQFMGIWGTTILPHPKIPKGEGASPSWFLPDAICYWPVELTNYLKPLVSEKDRNKIKSLWGECLLKNDMHNAIAVLKRLILDKEELTAEQDQLVAERNQIVARLPELETQDAEATELEAQLQQSEKEVVTLSQETAQLRVQFEEARAKWIGVHNVVLAASDHEAISNKRLNNLEVALYSKTEEVVAAEEKYARLEESHKIFIEHNRVFSTVRDLEVSLQATRSEGDNLLTEVDHLKEEL
ncbi:uncharacterized protein [Nicotiana sylvestris]|uniref:uncharacterized protein n=1 Tax=Nicotiana sylvestris TaxID=4096 RepID=UPI00388CA5E7